MNVHDLTPGQILTLLAYFLGCVFLSFGLCVAISDRYSKFEREQWVRLRRLDGSNRH